MEEYFARQRMKELGYTTNFSELDELSGKVFMLISTEIDKARNKKK